MKILNQFLPAKSEFIFAQILILIASAIIVSPLLAADARLSSGTTNSAAKVSASTNSLASKPAESSQKRKSLFSWFQKSSEPKAITLPKPGPPTLNPAGKRITDQAIAADMKTLESVQKRLVDLNNQGATIGSYHFSKAQAWLDFARDEYTSNDRTGVIEAALKQSLEIIQQMENKATNISRETILLPTSKKIRTDLWLQVETFKTHTNFNDAQDVIAQLEVQLVWAGHEDRQLGWRQAKPFIQAAERLARDAQARLNGEKFHGVGVNIGNTGRSSLTNAPSGKEPAVFPSSASDATNSPTAITK